MVLALLLAACAGGPKIRTSHLPSARFDGLVTYAWMPREPTGDPLVDDEALDGLVKQAADAALAAKGYRLDGENADFLVAFRAVTREETDVTDLDERYGLDTIWDRDYTPRSDPARGKETFERTYHVGTLILNISDGKTKRLVWRGAADTEVNLREPSRKRDRAIDEAVGKLLERFPPE